MPRPSRFQRAQLPSGHPIPEHTNSTMAPIVPTPNVPKNDSLTTYSRSWSPRLRKDNYLLRLQVITNERCGIMTREEFISSVEDGQIIYCSCIEERNEVLQYLLNCGFEIGETSLEYLEPGNCDDKFLSPGIGLGSEYISCYRNSALNRGKRLIHYDKISSLIEELPQNEMSDEEFKESLLDLIAG